MKKIMQINVTCGRGSTGKIAKALHDYSLQCNYDSCFAYAEFQPSLETAFRIESKWQRILRKASNRIFGRKQKHSTFGTRRLIRYIEKEKPDLIHLHNIHHNIVNYPMFFEYLNNCNIPVVFTLHDCWLFTGWCYHYLSLACEEYRFGCVECVKQFARDDSKVISAKAAETKQKLVGENKNIYPVCVSAWLCNCARSSYMGQMKHVPEVIYNGINVDMFYPRTGDNRKQFGLSEDCFMILSVASYWNENKGLSIFRKLSNLLCDDMIIVLVGQGLETVTEKNIICMSGTENQKQLAQLYSAADVFINGSREETFGLTTAEALACGTPAIVFNSTACPEIVDEQTGIVANYDLDSVFEAVITVKNRGKQAYSDHCVNRARLLFDEKRMVREYMELYRRILHGE